MSLPKYPARNVRLLLSGVPGGGKTWMGNELAGQGATHIDMEADRHRLAQDCLADPASFVKRLPDGDLVVSWGFDPFAALTAVRVLVAMPLVPVWFDGDRSHFYRQFMLREQQDVVHEVDFYGQMVNIIKTGIKTQLPWIEFDPFTEDGSFAPGNVRRLLKEVRVNGEDQ